MQNEDNVHVPHEVSDTFRPYFTKEKLNYTYGYKAKECFRVRG
jgi:hypothetical protein